MRDKKLETKLRLLTLQLDNWKRLHDFITYGLDKARPIISADDQHSAAFPVVTNRVCSSGPKAGRRGGSLRSAKPSDALLCEFLAFGARPEQLCAIAGRCFCDSSRRHRPMPFAHR